MQRLSRPLLVHVPPASRPFSSSWILTSKASKARGKITRHRKTVSASSSEPLRGKSSIYSHQQSVGQGGLLEEEEPVRREQSPVDQVQSAMLDGQGQTGGSWGKVDERWRATGVGASQEPFPEDRERVVLGRDEPKRDENGERGEEEPIYTAQAPFNVPLLMTACFAFATFSLNAADMARVGYASYNETTEEYELAAKWKRYTYAGGFASVATALVLWGTLAPGRIITRMTIQRAPRASTRYPKDAIVSIYTPITKLPGLGKPRQVELGSLRLLGPISDGPRPWHPKVQNLPNKPRRNDPLSRIFRKLTDMLIAEPSSSRQNNRWSKTSTFSHVPLLVAGDRFSYSFAKKRAPSGKMDDPKGACLEDWEAFEKTLLENDHQVK